MNKKMVVYTICRTMRVGALMFLIPLFVGLCYGENSILPFLVPLLILLLLSIPSFFVEVEDKTIYAREGFVIVAVCWIMLSLVGSLPFIISGTISKFVDALFETVSGFSTTGASILTGERIDELFISSKAIMFWRSFTHFIGGMGVLVFVLALFPNSGQGAIHLYRAEAPGPQSSKLVSKISKTARILYLIYIGLTLLETVLLLFSGIGLYESVLNAFSTAGTGGFGLHGNSIEYYDSTYIEMVIASFMFLFGINFNVYYFILIGSVSKALKSEELKVYLAIVFLSTLLIALNLLSTTLSFVSSLRYAFFQVTSISSTTGFSTANFDGWPAFSKSILLFLTIIGACGGSTGGGIKVSRLIVLSKSAYSDIKKMIHPRAVVSQKFEEEIIRQDMNRNVRSFFILWIFIVILSTIILSFDSYSGSDVFTSFSATLACIGNVGPGFNGVGPMLSYTGFNGFSKIVMCILMLAGRLEIFPMVILFAPRTWKKNS